jgi:hypothetical protein
MAGTSPAMTTGQVGVNDGWYELRSSAVGMNRFSSVIARNPEGAMKQSRIGAAALDCFASLAIDGSI